MQRKRKIKINYINICSARISHLENLCDRLMKAQQEINDKKNLVTKSECVIIKDKIDELFNAAGNLRKCFKALNGVPPQSPKELEELEKQSKNVVKLDEEIARMFDYITAKKYLMNAINQLIDNPQMATQNKSVKGKITEYLDSVVKWEGGIEKLDNAPLQTLKKLQTRSENPLILDDHLQLLKSLSSMLSAEAALLPQQSQPNVLVKGYSDGQKAQDSQSQFAVQLEQKPTTTVKPICQLILPPKQPNHHH